MYNAKLITDNGDIVSLGYEYGVLFDITPLSGVAVDINSSQGFQQIGTTVESMSVGGISRTIKGVFLNKSLAEAQSILDLLPVFTKGKLYFEDIYYCDFAVSKTPTFVQKHNKTSFTMMLYCQTPFWYSAEEHKYEMGVWRKLFSLPTTYDTHIYADKDANAFVDCYVNGNTKVAPTIRFSADSSVVNYGLMNAETQEFIKFNDTLLNGDVVDVYRENNKLYATRTRAGVTTDIFYALDEDSSLYWLNPRNNILRAIADSNVQNMQCVVSFRDAYMGVLDVH